MREIRIDKGHKLGKCNMRTRNAPKYAYTYYSLFKCLPSEYCFTYTVEA